LGIGNTIRGDDGIGIYIAEEIKMEKDRENAHSCDAGGGVRGKFMGVKNEDLRIPGL
jgi:Ni,Fe-hydrogenase maturation factor